MILKNLALTVLFSGAVIITGAVMAQDTVVAVPEGAAETAQASEAPVAPVVPEAPVVSVIDSADMPPPMTASEETVPPDPALVAAEGTADAAPETQGETNAMPAPTEGSAATDAPANSETVTDTPPLDGLSQLLSMQNWSTPVEKEMAEQLNYTNPQINVNAMPSLFLTTPEIDLILDARKGLNTRPVDDPSLPNAIPDAVSHSHATSVDAPREIKLSGILYKSKTNWVIWLNNKRITPKALPSEVYDLKVHKNYIELEWFDGNTNQIYPIRLRPHQRFNLDARIFLPG